MKLPAFLLLFPVFTCLAVEPIPQVRAPEASLGVVAVNPARFETVTSARPLPSSLPAVEMLKKHLQTLPPDDGGKKVKLYLAQAGDALFADTPLAGVKLERPQEYLLRFEDSGEEVKIYAAGADNRGLFYAAATLKQLLSKEGLELRNLRDYPEWTLRYTGGYNPISTAQMEQLAQFKINGFGIQHRYDWRKFGPDERPLYAPKQTYREWFEEIRAFRERHGDLVDFMMMQNVYCGKRLDAANPEDMKLLIRQCLFAAPYVEEIMIQFDDFTPFNNDRFVFVSEGEKAKFKNPGEMHGWITRQVYEAVKKEFPKVAVSVCPAPYSLHNHNAQSPPNREYLASLGRELPEDVPVVWTGPAVESAKVTREEYRQYQELVGGHRLYLWDNTSNMKSTPMEIWETTFFPEMSRLDGRIYVNGHGFSFFWSRLFAVNANDYLWNPQNYNAERSYAAGFRQITGREIPDFVTQTRRDIVAVKNTWDRAARGKIAERILNRKEEFRSGNLEFQRIERTAKPVFDECSVEFKKGTVPRLAAIPKLDASGSDPAWEKAEVYRLGTTNYPTTVRLGYTQESLFIQFRGQYGKAAAASKTLERDDKLDASGDVFTICLQPPLRNQRAGWIAIDRDGNLFDYKEWQPSENFNPAIRKTIQVFPEYWILEVEIPFKELAGHIMHDPPKSGSKWNLNFVRNNRLDGEIATWSPAPEKEVINKKYFGTVTFQ